MEEKINRTKNLLMSRLARDDKFLIRMSLNRIQELIDDPFADAPNRSEYLTDSYSTNLGEITDLAKNTNILINILRESEQVEKIPENINLDVKSLVKFIESIPPIKEDELMDERLSEVEKQKQRNQFGYTLVDLCRRQNLTSVDVVKSIMENPKIALKPEEKMRILKDRPDISKIDSIVLTRGVMGAIAGEKGVEEEFENAEEDIGALVPERDNPKDVSRED